MTGTIRTAEHAPSYCGARNESSEDRMTANAGFVQSAPESQRTNCFQQKQAVELRGSNDAGSPLE